MKKVAKVFFPDNYYNKKYNFITDIEGLEQDDVVVVDTRNGLALATFFEYDELGFGETGAKKPTKWIIQKVDLEKHLARVEAAEKAEELKRAMEEKRKQTQELEVYRILAEKDPEMKKMIEEFEKLQELI